MKTNSQIAHESNQPLFAGHIKKKMGINYLDGEHVIRTTNSIFQPTGWDVMILETQFFKMDTDKPVVVSRVRVTVHYLTPSNEERMCIKEDWGTGMGNTKYFDQNIDNAVKSSVTDGFKRCMRYFGDQFGLCLYDSGTDNIISDVEVKKLMLSILEGEVDDPKEAGKALMTKYPLDVLADTAQRNPVELVALAKNLV